MRFQETPLAGAYVIEQRRFSDHRGYFARVWCKNELRERGLEWEVAQINTGFSPRRGTLRGLHFQRPPQAEVKIVRCTRGAIYDVIVDLRCDSSTYLKWHGVELSGDNGRVLYVPRGFAQGYITLTNDAEMYYLTSEFYEPESASGIRHDDPAFAIDWPLAVASISEQDAGWQDYLSREAPFATQ